MIFGQRGQTATHEQAYHIKNGAVVAVATNCEVACLLVKGEEREVKLATNLKYALPYTTRTSSGPKHHRQKLLTDGVFLEGSAVLVPDCSNTRRQTGKSLQSACQAALGCAGHTRRCRGARFDWETSRCSGPRPSRPGSRPGASPSSSACACGWAYIYYAAQACFSWTPQPHWDQQAKGRLGWHLRNVQQASPAPHTDRSHP